MASTGGLEPGVYWDSSFKAVTALDKTFERPATFDLAAWSSESTRAFEERLWRDRAVLRVTETGMKHLAPRVRGRAHGGGDLVRL